MPRYLSFEPSKRQDRNVGSAYEKGVLDDCHGRKPKPFQNNKHREADKVTKKDVEDYIDGYTGG